MLTQARLKELVRYSPDTGEFVRLVSVPGPKPSGGRHADGYALLRVDGEQYMCHHLARLYMTGELSNSPMDHINGVRDDNRWCNLREATVGENNRNCKIRSHNKSGHTGVSWYKRYGKWRVQVKHEGVVRHVGYFTDLQEAADAAKNARDALFGEFSPFAGAQKS